MAQSSPRIEFGLHSMTPYARTSKTIGSNTYLKGQPFGILEVLGDASFSMNASSVDLYGGSNKNLWASEISQIATELTVNVRSSPDFLYDLYAGGSVSETTASSTGTINTATNQSGTSIINATTGIASATIKAGSEADLKFGAYLIKYVSATTIDIYSISNLQFTRGTDLTYQDDLLKITTAPLTVVASTAVEIPGTGLELTGGSGIISFTDGTAIFQVSPPHGGVSEITLGQTGLTFVEHGLYLYANERSSGDLFELHIHKATSSAGMTIPLSNGGFQATDLTIKCLYDSDANAVATIRALTPE